MVLKKGQYKPIVNFQFVSKIAWGNSGNYFKFIDAIIPFIQNNLIMPKYIIEREVPGAGHLTESQLEAILQVSNNALVGMGPQIKWEQSYLTEDKFYCIYTAPNKEIIREHARTVGLPATNISEVIEMLDATTHTSDHVHESWYYE